MSGWRPDVPVELPDGTICCQAHHRVICGICCCDYSFIQELADSDADDLAEDEQLLGDSDSDKDSAAFETGRHMPFFVLRELPSGGGSDSDSDSEMTIDYTPATLFIPPRDTDTPDMLFAPRVGFPFHRFVRRTNRRQILVYTDGACSNNGRDGAIGGCGFVYKGGELPAGHTGIVSFRLEDRGPSGVAYPHTSNRAELRAVIAALQFRAWNDERYEQLVIATDSEYVQKGATQWIAGWVKRGWKTSSKKDVANRDLWDLLFREIQKFKERGPPPLRVMFWHIPRALNTAADKAAKEAAATGTPQQSFCVINGVLC